MLCILPKIYKDYRTNKQIWNAAIMSIFGSMKENRKCYESKTVLIDLWSNKCNMLIDAVTD